MRTARHPTALAFASLLVGCADRKGSAPQPTPPSHTPTIGSASTEPVSALPPDPLPLFARARLSPIPLPNVAKDGLVSISPSGKARLYRQKQPDSKAAGFIEVTWCLHRDDAKPTCLPTQTSELFCHGGSKNVGWRPDETAVVLCGLRTERDEDGSQSLTGWDTVIDFGKGEVHQIDPLKSAMVSPYWSRDGLTILGFPRTDAHDEESHTRPYSRKVEPHPVGLPAANPEEPRVLRNGEFVRVWEEATGAVVFFDGPSMTRTRLEFASATQKIQDTTPDGRFAIAEDDKVSKGWDGIPWHVVEFDSKKAIPLGIPEGFDEPTHVQLSNGGQRVLALWKGDDGQSHLSMTNDRGATWRLLYSWSDTDEHFPHEYVSDGELRWDGGATAWIVSSKGAVLRVDLSE